MKEQILGFGVAMATAFIEVRFLKDTPAVIGTDFKTYGPYEKGDIAALPSENAKIFIKMKIAEKRYAPPKEPTLKEKFKGEVLTGFIEAAKVRPLVDVELREYITERLVEMGLPEEEVESETERIYDESMRRPNPREFAEQQIDLIEKRELAKLEEEESREALRRAKEKVEKILKEIRETRGE